MDSQRCGAYRIDEKLRAPTVRSSICHTQSPRLIAQSSSVFVWNATFAVPLFILRKTIDPKKCARVHNKRNNKPAFLPVQELGTWNWAEGLQCHSCCSSDPLSVGICKFWARFLLEKLSLLQKMGSTRIGA